ncbi:MAG TPA: ferritin-like domain-containing protein [Candidatus Brocadiia bacterium]|nr:ferritin [Planctomycetota bacterium]MDO8093509.1 ferritin-like domain-containing protein [Candidatus Brocadiales bacterium]
MSKNKIIDALNAARKEELTSILQYLQHHYLAKGLESPPVADLLKEFSITEMKHAYALAERIVALGGKPETKTDPLKIPGKLTEMIKVNLDLEKRAIASYKEWIKLASNDSTTRLLLEGILADEEEIATKLSSLLEK